MATTATPTAPDSKPKLSEQRELFCHEFVVDWCGAEAARRAGYSARRARQVAYELRQDPTVNARIDELAAEMAQQSRVRSHLFREEIARVALSSLDHYEITDEGRVTIKRGAPNGAMAAIKSIRRKVIVRRDKSVVYDTEVTLHDKVGALTTGLKLTGDLRDTQGLVVPEGYGVLAVPVVANDSQWATAAVAQQMATLQRTTTAKLPVS